MSSSINPFQSRVNSRMIATANEGYIQRADQTLSEKNQRDRKVKIKLQIMLDECYASELTKQNHKIVPKILLIS